MEEVYLDITEFKAGEWKQGYKYKYFLPEKINHSFTWNNPKITILLEKAASKLGELNSFSRFVPDTDTFILMHELKEAVVSSRIEGTKTNIEEALTPEADIDPEKRDDWQEVNNYVKAMNNAIEELKSIPLSCRLLKDTHKILLSSGRGEYKTPGEFRRSQNWIGGNTLTDAIFIPPADSELSDLLTDFEMFLNNEDIPALIRIAIAHYQFETIHPFLDGNGRIGRLLITLFFVANKMLEMPLLYLSSFFEKNRALYYDNLTMTRERNDLEHWIIYFLTGVEVTAETGVQTLQQIMELKSRLEKNEIMEMGKKSKTAYDFLQKLFKQPIVTIKDVQTITGLSAKSSGALVQDFIEHKILVDLTKQERNNKYCFAEYINLFSDCM